MLRQFRLASNRRNVAVIPSRKPLEESADSVIFASEVEKMFKSLCVKAPKFSRTQRLQLQI